MKISTLNRIFILCFGCIFILFLYSEGFFSKKPEPIPPAQRNIHLFTKVTQIVRENYVDRIDEPEKKFKSAYTRMLAALDKNSTYLDARDSEMFRLFNKNKTCSCGIHGYKLSKYFYITDIIPESPAARGGLKAGFLISSINKKNITRQSFWQILLSLHSTEPEGFRLGVLKTPGEKVWEITVNSERLANRCRIDPVQKEVMVISLPRFDPAAVKILRENSVAISGRNVVLDLRNYSGGDRASFEEIAGFFLPAKVELLLKFKESSRIINLAGMKKKGKLVAIIDESTILYSELLAALLKSEKVMVIGVKTRGMADELQQFPLRDGSSILLAAGFFLRDDVKISGRPVKPDLVIKRKEFQSIIQRAVILAGTNGKKI